jgi:hypothetical protein
MAFLVITDPDMIVPTLQQASAVGGLRFDRRSTLHVGREDVTDLAEALHHSGLITSYEPGGEGAFGEAYWLTRAGRLLLDALLADPSLIETPDVGR